MSPEYENLLVTRYPALFSGRTFPLTESLMGFGCECDDGWFNILDTMCAALASAIKNGHWKNEEPYRFTQIKEKYAGLRVYDWGRTDYMDGIVDMAEALSYVTCETCGRPGVVCCAAGGYWLKTLCPDHAREFGYRTLEEAKKAAGEAPE